MLDPSLIEWKYSNMTNEQLIQLAEKEYQKLSGPVLKILNSEFEKRKLDFTKYKKYQSIFLNDGDNKSNTSLYSLWELAFNLRRENKSDIEIERFLIEKGLTSLDASLTITRLPASNNLEEGFENIIFHKSENETIQVYLLLAVIFGISLYFLNWAIVHQFIISLFPCLIFGLMGFYFLKKSNLKFRGGNFWVNMIKENPENIVWIKPIVEKHTVWYLITLFKVQNFQFLTKDGLSINMKIDTAEEQKIFFDGIKINLPHAQIGYSPKIDLLYDFNPKNFIKALQARNLYTPIDKLKY